MFVDISDLADSRGGKRVRVAKPATDQMLTRKFSISQDFFCHW
jgi:hypothetical protein